MNDSPKMNSAVQRHWRYPIPIVMVFLALVMFPQMGLAHEGHSHAPTQKTKEKIIQLNMEPPQYHFVAFQDAPETKEPDVARMFQPFHETVKVRFDQNFLFVESNGLPDHPMMIGITNWQQQVPLPQSYTGNNAWQIPLHPVPANNPISTRNAFLRGAIALAVNGVPIFNPLNNRGEDAFKIGELDEYGGHCGRADDYHYHIAPVHLEKFVGAGNPVAIALDGYPIYGYNDPDGKPPTNLDWLNGHKDADGLYHYHATKTYPYLNGGFYGEVTERGGQVDPQPRAEPIRPDLRPLRDAKITGFTQTGNRFQLEYDVTGRKGVTTYLINEDGKVDFTFQEPSGRTRTDSYRSRSGKLFLSLSGTSARHARSSQPQRSDKPALTVTSSAIAAGDEMPIDFTGDGVGTSPPVAWSDGPEGTQCYALNLWHTPGPGDVKSYWLLYDIPAGVTSLPKGASGIGTSGYNDKGNTSYDPMKSKGPGVKQYHITVFALSEKPKFKTEKVTRQELLRSISEITLAEGTLNYQYTRTRSSSWLIVLVSALVAIASITTLFVYRKEKSRAGSVTAVIRATTTVHGRCITSASHR